MRVESLRKPDNAGLPTEWYAMLSHEPNQHVDGCFQVDVWAVGVLAYELVIGEAPFFHVDPATTRERIMAGAVGVRFPDTRANSPWADFIRSALVTVRMFKIAHLQPLKPSCGVLHVLTPCSTLPTPFSHRLRGQARATWPYARHTKQCCRVAQPPLDPAAQERCSLCAAATRQGRDTGPQGCSKQGPGQPAA